MVVIITIDVNRATCGLTKVRDYKKTAGCEKVNEMKTKQKTRAPAELVVMIEGGCCKRSRTALVVGERKREPGPGCGLGTTRNTLQIPFSQARPLGAELWDDGCPNSGIQILLKVGLVIVHPIVHPSTLPRGVTPTDRRAGT